MIAGFVELKVGFFRGTECRVTGWSSNPDSLAASMAKIRCQAGRTQILRLMRLAESETATAVIYVGDVFEECFPPVRLGPASTCVPGCWWRQKIT